MSSSVLDRSRTRARPSDWKVVVQGAPPAEPSDAAELGAPIEQRRPFRNAPVSAAPRAIVRARPSTTFLDLARLLMVVAGLAGIVVAVMGTLLSDDGVSGLFSAPAKIVAYEGTSPENVRFLIGSGSGQVAAVPGALIMGWHPDQTDSAVAMTLGNPTSDPVLAQVAEDGTTIQAIRYPSAWPGVDLEIRSTPMGWSSNAIVAPGVDPSSVVMEYTGGTDLSLDGAGRLHIRSASGAEWVDGTPESWQDGPTGRTPVDSSFVLLGGGRFGFNVGGYDTGSPLVIDPPAERVN